MTSGQPDLQWAAKIQATAVFCLAGAAAGAGLYFANLAYTRAVEPLEVTGVALSTTNLQVGCHGKADIIGTIATNGHAGTITYQWVENGTAQPALVVDNASGSNRVQVQLEWILEGSGTGQAIAEIRVLSPTQEGSSISIPYSCPQ